MSDPPGRTLTGYEPGRGDVRVVGIDNGDSPAIPGSGLHDATIPAMLLWLVSPCGVNVRAGRCPSP